MTVLQRFHLRPARTESLDPTEGTVRPGRPGVTPQPSVTSIQAMQNAEAVFVDPTGRRRRLVVAAGLGLGAILLAAIAVLVAGLTGAAPVPLPGLPGANHGVMRGEVGAVDPAPAHTPDGRSRTPSPAPSPAPAAGATTGASLTASPTSPSPTGPPGHRRTAHPGNPKPS